MNAYLDPYTLSPEPEDPPFGWFANPDTNRVEYTSYDCGLIGPFDFEDEAVNALLRIAQDEFDFTY